jgi:hypothetical protein
MQRQGEQRAVKKNFTQVKENQSGGQPRGSEFFFYQFYDVAYVAIIH